MMSREERMKELASLYGEFIEHWDEPEWETPTMPSKDWLRWQMGFSWYMRGWRDARGYDRGSLRELDEATIERFLNMIRRCPFWWWEPKAWESWGFPDAVREQVPRKERITELLK